MSSTKKSGRPSAYETDFKIAVAREYLTSNLGYGALSDKYGLRIDLVRLFVKWYKSTYPAINIEDTPHTDVSHKGPLEYVALQKELQQANLKITALEMLMENVQKELGVDIIKKPGTKQSVQ
jgi:hypothetical protein